MVDNKTKADLEKELAEVYKELESVKGENQAMRDAGTMDLTGHVKKAEDLKKENEKLKAEVKVLKEKERDRQIEAEIRAHDLEEKERQEKLPFLSQSEHTRFRLAPGPKLRDIFGNVGEPCFNLGVTLDSYSGDVDVPLKVVIEMAQSIGMLTYEQAEELAHKYNVEKAKNEAAADLGNILVDGITGLISDFHHNLDAVGLAAHQTEHAGTNSNHLVDEELGQSDIDAVLEESDGVSGDSADSDSGNDSGEDDDQPAFNFDKL